MRKLASVQKVVGVEPIEGADRIELVRVLGWQCVSGKGDFKIGDLCIYFEVDSFLPVEPEYEILRKSSYKNNEFMGEGFKLKTMKFKGQISQGLVLKPENISKLSKLDLSEGDDVTEILGIREWDVPETVTSQGTIKPGRPDFIPKTDETRCFDGNVKVITDAGLIKLCMLFSKFKHGKDLPKVLSYNFDKKVVEYDTILNVQKYNADRELCKIVVPMKFGLNRTNTLICTLDHKIYSSNGWVEAKNIGVGDKVFFNSFCYSDDVIPLIAGMLLGDGCLSFEKRKSKSGEFCSSYNFSFCHGEKQIDYFNEKRRLLGIQDNIVRKYKSGYCDNIVYHVDLHSDDSIRIWLSTFIVNNDFVVNKSFIEKLTDVSLAFWYMDDGSIVFSEKQRPVIRLHTCAYLIDEIELLREWLLNTYGIRTTICKDGSKGQFNSIRISSNSIDVFQSVVAPYICDSMRYKLEEKYRTVPYVLRTVEYNRSDRLVPVKVLKKEVFKLSKYSTTRAVYNIETSINHNYFASRMLVHNCQSEPFLMDEFKGLPYYITTKMDGSSHSVGYSVSDGMVYTSHNCTISDDGRSAFVEYVKNKGISDKIKEYATDNGIFTLTVQGEWCGGGIQKNRLKLMQPEWFVFTVIIDGQRVGLEKLKGVCKEIGALMVPVEETGDDLLAKYSTMDSLLDRAVGEGYNHTQREGIVIRPIEPVYSEIVHGPLSMKVLNNNYLLKFDD